MQVQFCACDRSIEGERVLEKRGGRGLGGCDKGADNRGRAAAREGEGRRGARARREGELL